MSPNLLLGGLLKLVAVVAVASVAGIVVGIGLAKLSGGSDEPPPVVAATAGVSGASTTANDDHASTQPTSTTTTEPRPTSTRPASTTTESGAVQGTANPIVDVAVLSARLGKPSRFSGHALLDAKVRVTNRAKTSLQITTALLLSGDFSVPLDSEERGAAGALIRPIAPGRSATGRLRFLTPSVVTRRLEANPTTHMRIADKTVELRLRSAQATTTATTTAG